MKFKLLIFFLVIVFAPSSQLSASQVISITNHQWSNITFYKNFSKVKRYYKTIKTISLKDIEYINKNDLRKKLLNIGISEKADGVVLNLKKLNRDTGKVFFIKFIDFTSDIVADIDWQYLKRYESKDKVKYDYIELKSIDLSLLPEDQCLEKLILKIAVIEEASGFIISKDSLDQKKGEAILIRKK